MGTQKFLKLFSKKSHSTENCRTDPKMSIPYLYTLRRTIAYAYTLPILFAYLNTCIPILIHWLDFRLHILIHASPILIHWVGFRLSAPIFPDLSQQHPGQPIRNKYYVNRVVSHSESITEETPQLRQPITIDYYVTRVVSQSESSITSPESSRLGWKTILGSRLEVARCSQS